MRHICRLVDYRNNRSSARPAPVFSSLASNVPSLSEFAAFSRPAALTARPSRSVRFTGAFQQSLSAFCPLGFAPSACCAAVG